MDNPLLTLHTLGLGVLVHLLRHGQQCLLIGNSRRGDLCPAFPGCISHARTEPRVRS